MVRKRCKDVNPHIKINGEVIGLFNYTYNDIKKSKKVSLEDVGVLAYGCFIYYEPVRMKWFKQFKKLAKENPDTLVWRLLQIRHRRFGRKEPRYKKSVEEPRDHAFLRSGMDRSNVFGLRISIKKTGTEKLRGINPLRVGFIVSPKSPISKCIIVLKLCEDRGEKIVLTTGSPRPFDHLYPGAGIYHGYFIVLNKKTKFWQKRDFEITVDENPAIPGDIITNFYQTKSAGQTARGAAGLDVAVSISSGRALYNIKWEFDDKKTPTPKPKKKSIKQTAHHSYKDYREKPYRGKVTAWDHEGKCQTRDFYVIMTKV